MQNFCVKQTESGASRLAAKVRVPWGDHNLCRAWPPSVSRFRLVVGQRQASKAFGRFSTTRPAARAACLPAAYPASRRCATDRAVNGLASFCVDFQSWQARNGPQFLADPPIPVRFDPGGSGKNPEKPRLGPPKRFAGRRRRRYRTRCQSGPTSQDRTCRPRPAARLACDPDGPQSRQGEQGVRSAPQVLPCCPCRYLPRGRWMPAEKPGRNADATGLI